MRNMVRGDKYQGILSVGQRVYSGLYGGRNGIILKINGDQRPGTIRSLGGGCVVMGGNAYIDVVFEEYVSRSIPESVIRGVQWEISEDIAPEGEILLAVGMATHAVEEQKKKEQKEAEERANTRQSLPAKYPFLVPVKDSGKSNHAMGAKNLKTHLSREFPGVKFSVRSDSYSGGDSIDVDWVNGPTVEEVKKISDRYQEGNFNGMEDIYEDNRDNVWPDVFGGAKYVMEQRKESPELITRAAKELGHILTADMFDKWGNIERLDVSEGLGETSEERRQRIYREARSISCVHKAPAKTEPRVKKSSPLQTILAD